MSGLIRDEILKQRSDLARESDDSVLCHIDRFPPFTLVNIRTRAPSVPLMIIASLTK